jgi:hypothetical protein
MLRGWYFCILDLLSFATRRLVLRAVLGGCDFRHFSENAAEIGSVAIAAPGGHVGQLELAATQQLPGALGADLREIAAKGYAPARLENP